MNDGRKGLMKKILAVLVAAGIISGAGLAAVLAATAKAANTTAAAGGEAAAATVEAVVQCGGTIVVCGGGGGGGIATGGGGVIATGGGGVVTGGGGVVTGGGIATGGGGVVCGGPVLVPPLGPTVIGCGIEGGVGPVMGSQTFAELMGLLFQLEFAPLASIGGNIIGSLIAIFESLAIGAAPLLEILASTFCSTAMAPVLAAVMGIAPYVAIVVVAIGVAGIMGYGFYKLYKYIMKKLKEHEQDGKLPKKPDPNLIKTITENIEEDKSKDPKTLVKDDHISIKGENFTLSENNKKKLKLLLKCLGAGLVGIGIIALIFFLGPELLALAGEVAIMGELAPIIGEITTMIEEGEFVQKGMEKIVKKLTEKLTKVEWPAESIQVAKKIKQNVFQ